MEIAEIKAALVALKNEIGPKSDVSLSISPRDKIHCFVRPSGYDKDDYFLAYGDDFAEAIEAARAEWAKRSDIAHEHSIRDLALAVIRITYDTGSCSDAQLRGDGFDAADVVRFGEQAVERANSMADKGPFSITVAAGANDAVAA